MTKTTTQATTNQAVVVPFLPSNGHFLKRIYHTLWSSNENYNTALDCENSSANAKVTAYNTYADSTKLQDDVVTCATATTITAINQRDWLLMEPFCRDTPILNYSLFQKNWTHIDDFCNPDLDRDTDVVSNQNLRCGLPMERAIQWQFTGNCPTATSYIHDNFAIFSRMLDISPNGIQFI